MPAADGRKSQFVVELPRSLDCEEALKATPRTEIETISFDECDSSLVAVWQRLRKNDSFFSSPFFSPDFSRTIHQARADVELAVFRQGKKVVGLLPFHRKRNTGFPVGRVTNDYHGIIFETPFSFDLRDLLRQAKIKAFDFHAWYSPGQLPLSCVFDTQPSFVARFDRHDLDQPDGSYRNCIEQKHRTLRRQSQKTRRLIRELGPLHFELNSLSETDFAKSVELKKQQYSRLETFDMLSQDWLLDSLRRFHRSDSEVQVFNSVLRFGETVVATHIGLVESGTLHFWLPSYDVRFAHGSPGICLLLESIDAAQKAGFTNIDFGAGEQSFKRMAANEIGHVPRGTISSSTGYLWKRRAIDRLINTIKSWPAHRYLRRVLRLVRPKIGAAATD